METTIDTSTGRYAVKAIVRMTGEVSDKVRTLVSEGIVSKGLYRGCFPDCRKLMAGLSLTDKKVKVPKLAEVIDKPFDLTVAKGIKGLVEIELKKLCDEVTDITVTEYVQGEKNDGIKRYEDTIRQQIRLGIMSPKTDSEIRDMALMLKNNK